MGDPLRAFLSGKRSGKRHALVLPILIHGRTVQMEAESVDVSANGIQFAVPVQEALPGVSGAIEVAAFTWLRNGFSDGVHIALPTAHVVAHADPVRTNLDPDDPTRLLVGCRLRKDLTDAELRRLGLRPEACGPENTVSDAPPEDLDATRFKRKKALPVSLHSFEDSIPIASGEVVAMGDQSLTVLLRGAKPQDILSKLTCLELHFDVRDGRKSVWASRAVVTALPSPTEDGIELGLWADTAPRRPILKRRGASAQ